MYITNIEVIFRRAKEMKRKKYMTAKKNVKK